MSIKLWPAIKLFFVPGLVAAAVLLIFTFIIAIFYPSWLTNENYTLAIGSGIISATIFYSLERASNIIFEEIKKSEKDFKKDKRLKNLGKEELRLEIDLLENELSHYVMLLPIFITLFLFVEQGNSDSKNLWLFVFGISIIVILHFISGKRKDKIEFLEKLRLLLRKI